MVITFTEYYILQKVDMMFILHVDVMWTNMEAYKVRSLFTPQGKSKCNVSISTVGNM